MKFFFGEQFIVQISNISALDTYKGILYMVDTNQYLLNNKEVADLTAILTEIHSQACAK